ncbi:MAG: hypothetical protein JWL73_1713 [Actinomycetia bacterium]|nr:hypothetical protein [Actinomycetes bacterium]
MRMGAGIVGRLPFTVRAAGGIAGPAAFTLAWITSSIRQVGYSVRDEHISGLAAPDARTPAIMIGGFVGLGTGTILFASALEEALGGPERSGPGPFLVRCAGAGVLAAAALRRDRMLLHPPEGVVGQSWRNDGHDIASGVGYACLVAAPLFFSHRFAHDPEWAALRTPAIVGAGVSAAMLVAFSPTVGRPYGGILQRVAVTTPMLASAAFAWRLLRRGT